MQSAKRICVAKGWPLFYSTYGIDKGALKPKALCAEFPDLLLWTADPTAPGGAWISCAPYAKANVASKATCAVKMQAELCRYGKSCTRKGIGCRFLHDPILGGGGIIDNVGGKMQKERQCWYGKSCTIKDCVFVHDSIGSAGPSIGARSGDKSMRHTSLLWMFVIWLSFSLYYFSLHFPVVAIVAQSILSVAVASTY